VYRCISAPGPTPIFLVRTKGDPAAMAQTIRLKVKELEPLRSVYEMEPLAGRIDGAFAENRLRTGVLAAFAVAALLLACVGLYGTLSYVVSLRRREIGLRFALGAARGTILRHFLGRVLSVVSIGCVGGLALSLALGRWLSGMLFGVSPFDALTIAAVGLVVMVVAMLAAAGPAARAALFDPMQVLRNE
jgi:putative ABC transport system permease protein